MNDDFVDLLAALLVRNQRASGRTRDIADLEALGEAP